jgi:mannitol-specific phosphotransferase system IIBC component
MISLTGKLFIAVAVAFSVSVTASAFIAHRKTSNLRAELAQAQEELAQVREIAEAARINTHINADNLRVVKKHWPGARHEQLDFMAEVVIQNGGE